ncbi:MAG: transcriptional regulator, TrmB [uncultured bacterium]|nr:MAG: transcriptional regulator, TrmB [uncultured bacterium]
MLQKTLQEIGLDDKEAKVYLASLELGEANIQRIAEKSGIKRTTVYDVLDSLKKMGVVSTVKKDKKIVYYAENPKVLEDGLDEKKVLLANIMPELLSFDNLIDKKPKVRYFEGFNGIKEVYLDTLKYPDREMLSWVAEEAFYDFDTEFLNNVYHPKRIKNKIWTREIASDDPETRKYQEKDESSLRKTKLLSEKKFPLDTGISLYGKNKIGIVSFNEEIGLIIESERIYRTLKSMFEFFWENL